MLVPRLHDNLVQVARCILHLATVPALMQRRELLIRKMPPLVRMLRKQKQRLGSNLVDFHVSKHINPNGGIVLAECVP